MNRDLQLLGWSMLLAGVVGAVLVLALNGWFS